MSRNYEQEIIKLPTSRNEVPAALLRIQRRCTVERVIASIKP